jgi:hypothetical protein
MKKSTILKKDTKEKSDRGLYRPIPFYKKNTLVYDYQLIRKKKKIIENRTLLEENGKKKNIRNAKLKTERFEHKFVFFGSIGLLSENRQELFHYKLTGKEKFHGEKVIIIEALPKKPSESIYLYGKVWLSENDFSIVKIEWNQASLKNFWGVWELAESIGAKPNIIFSSEYTFEKNGIRFPSKYSVKENYTHPIWRTIAKSVTNVIYKDYKFFTVETEVRFSDTNRLETRIYK